MREAIPEDDAIMLYTGGTTGRAKGVPLSHLNIVSNALQLGIELGPRAEDVYLHVAPMFHSADLLATPWVMAGASHVYLPKFSGESVLQAIQDYGVTVTLMTPTMLVRTMQEPQFERFDISSLRQIIYGSSPMAVEWIKRMLGRFKGAEAIQAYGLTETSPILTLLPMSDHLRAVETGNDKLLGSVGRQLSAVDLRIVDDKGQNLACGEAGEIVVRGPNVTKGYIKRPAATQESFKNGWFYTGDIGRLDEDGYLFLLDRKKDMIITGGEIVFSAEVEAVLYQYTKVDECAVIGVPDETYGEALLAVIVPAPGQALEAEELIAHCRGKIGGYKIPRRYVFVDQLPKSAVDKVLKTKLRQTYEGKE
jgi:long-chain acyl-CoA synthetase